MKRDITQKLNQWAGKKNRKPLILHGIRQSGKTFSLKRLGKEVFPRFHYFNFEEDPTLADIFTPDLKPKRILAELGFHINTPIDPEHDLVIFDEIQACPNALTSLKYFCENMPQLALAAAGSLLGLHLTPASFPVGKVELLTLHAMNFVEFLFAIDKTMQAEFLLQVNLETTIPESIHQQLWQSLKTYWVVGGMPEVVAEFAALSDDYYTAIATARARQAALITMYQADVAKHSGKVNAMHIDRIWRAVPSTLARTQDGGAQKFKFKDIIPGIDRYARMASAIDWLVAAGLVIKVPIAHSGLLPLAAYTQESAFKLYLPDVGLLGALAQLPPKTILNHDYGTYKGYFAENFIAQELLAHDTSSLFAWQEGRAEVEFLYVAGSSVIPLEVKSGWITKAKSLQTFADKYHPPYRVIFSAHNLKLQQEAHHYPLYVAGQFPLEGK